MAKILSLDTATKVCSVALHQNGQLIGSQSYHLQRSHSNLLPAIVKELLINCESEVKDLDAVAVSEGPGSYTGLRIGTATAKGLAFTLDIPLIALDTLDSMVEQVRRLVVQDGYLMCPMIDARRMEVYCKVVDQNRVVLWNTQPVIVDENTFDEFSGSQLVLFGNGSDKLKSLFKGDRFSFISDIHPRAEYMGTKAYEKFHDKDFVDVAYFEPEYLKEYRTNTPSQKFKV